MKKYILEESAKNTIINYIAQVPTGNVPYSQVNQIIQLLSKLPEDNSEITKEKK